ncbi:hypothetical protein BESB_068100 [Besnoitia besnoiti]|uniref:Transmembrane protein n=1 Tax=Besnoitia besnoiti TaxID=94643 RepID=A0A2A9MGQ8_BESBE|nr:hypothetical protein BESB_068100 [Besnoitia besnoiti]PFH34777.1 hypothetical protein BESB_068100 [Besnoitia besnoiti]
MADKVAPSSLGGVAASEGVSTPQRGAVSNRGTVAVSQAPATAGIAPLVNPLTAAAFEDEAQRKRTEAIAHQATACLWTSMSWFVLLGILAIFCISYANVAFSCILIVGGIVIPALGLAGVYMSKRGFLLAYLIWGTIMLILLIAMWVYNVYVLVNAVDVLGASLGYTWEVGYIRPDWHDRFGFPESHTEDHSPPGWMRTAFPDHEGSTLFTMKDNQEPPMSGTNGIEASLFPPSHSVTAGEDAQALLQVCVDGAAKQPDFSTDTGMVLEALSTRGWLCAYSKAEIMNFRKWPVNCWHTCGYKYLSAGHSLSSSDPTDVHRLQSFIEHLKSISPDEQQECMLYTMATACSIQDKHYLVVWVILISVWLLCACIGCCCVTPVSLGFSGKVWTLLRG